MVLKSLLCLTLLTFFAGVLKLVLGILTSTSVLIADAFHTFSDLVSYFALLFSTFVIERKNERFPYGYYKVESLLSLIFSILLIYLGFKLLSFSEIQPIYSEVGLISEIFFALFSGGIGIYQVKLGKESMLKSVEIVGKEKLIDVLISLGGALAIFSRSAFFQKIFMILVFSLIILASFDGVRDGVISLLDMEPDLKFKEALKKEIEKVGKIKEIKVRKAGPCYFVDLVLFFPPSFNLREFEIKKEKIKGLLSKFKNICEVFISPEIEEKKVVLGIPVDGSRVSESFSRAREFLIVEDKKRRRLKNPYLKKKVRRGAAVARFLLENGVNVVIVSSIGSIAYSTLKSGGAVILGFKGDIEEALKKFREGKLKEVKEPKVRA